MIERHSIANDLGVAAGKLSVPGLVVGASVAGFTLQDWVYIGTLAILFLQGAHIVWKWRREARKTDDPR
jgi:uncharacterized membrane protein YfcA